MPCPNCGGNEREPIAPGYWRCLSIIALTEMRPVLGPGAGMRPVSTPRQCHAEYHEQVGTDPGMKELCECGTFAIGQCAECDVPVCGHHSGLIDGRRLCYAHYAARQHTQLLVAADAELGKHLAVAAERLLPGGADPTLQFMNVMALTGSGTPLIGYLSGRPGGTGMHIQSADDREALRRTAAETVCSWLTTRKSDVFDASGDYPPAWKFHPESLGIYVFGRAPSTLRRTFPIIKSKERKLLGGSRKTTIGHREAVYIEVHHYSGEGEGYSATPGRSVDRLLLNDGLIHEISHSEPTLTETGSWNKRPINVRDFQKLLALCEGRLPTAAR